MSNYQIVNATAFVVAALTLFVMSRIEVQILAEDGEQGCTDLTIKAFGIMVALAAYGAVHLLGSIFVE